MKPSSRRWIGRPAHYMVFGTIVLLVVASSVSILASSNRFQSHAVSIENRLTEDVRVRSVGRFNTWNIDLRPNAELQDRSHAGGERVFVVWGADGRLLTYDARSVHGNMNGRIHRDIDGTVRIDFGYGSPLPMHRR